MLKELQEAIEAAKRAKTPNFPDAYRPKPKKSKSPANELTKIIKQFCDLNGHHCSIVSTQGTYREGVGYTTGNNTLGASDTSIIMRNKNGVVIAWECEVKIGNDGMSDDQKEYEASVIRAGGHYSVVKTYDDFYEGVAGPATGCVVSTLRFYPWSL